MECEDSIRAMYPSDEKKVAAELEKKQQEFLRDSGFVEVYPIMGYSYKQVKEQELNLGLDLQGGMHVTLEVSIPDLILALSENSTNEAFRNAIAEAKELQKSDDADYVTLFEQTWNEQDTNVELWRIFNSPDNRERFPAKSTDDEIFAQLRVEAEAAINNTENVIKKRIDQFGVAQPVVQKQAFSGRIMVELPGVKDRERALKKLKSTANLEFWHTFTFNEVATSLVIVDSLARDNDASAPVEDVVDASEEEGNVLDDLLDQAEDTAENAEEAVEDATDEAQQAIEDLIGGDEDDAADLTGDVDTSVDGPDPVKNPLLYHLKLAPSAGGSPAAIAVCQPHDTARVNSILKLDRVQSAIPPQLVLMWGARTEMLSFEEGAKKEPYVILYALNDQSGKRKAPLDGSVITNAMVGYEYGNPHVQMSMDATTGAPKWLEMTTEASSQGKRAIAVTMDNFVYSAPSVNEPIPRGNSRISLGQGSTNELIEEATDLSQLLKAGSLPAPARVVDEYTVGPSLGEENINRGLLSFAIALIVILVYMVFYYKGAGLVSDIALIANLFFLVGALASIGAALTLPGIAGIVLTIGMAVDANVLIYERIREEMRHGKGLAQALKDGYQKAYSAIVDANLTTLLTAIILFAFGSGPIQGFATTLIIGIFTSLFSAIVITRLIFFNRLEKKKGISFYTNMTKNWFTNMDYQFVKKRKTFYIISGVIIVAGLASLFTKGVDYGVDFEGGTSVDVTFQQSIDRTALEGAMATAFTTEDGPGSPTIQAIGSDDRRWKIETDFMINSEAQDRDEQFDAALKGGLTQVSADYELGEKIKVDPSMSDDFRRGATQATVFALIVIFLYIFFRFRKWQFGLGALLAMVHDVIIVLSLFSIFYGIMPFSMEIDQAFIAAILTVIGYSINDTVVVFDRIREYLIEFKREDDKTVINKALNSTLSRTINTSLSTFVVLLTIFLLGGDAIKGFTFALMIGVIVGTYSSIFIATPSVIDLSKSVRTED